MSSATEDHRADRADLDLRPTLALVELINEEDSTVPAAVRAAAEGIAAAIDAIVGRLERGGRLVYAGAGSSGWMARADAAECGPTFGLPDGLVVAVAAEGEALEDDAGAGADALAALRPTAADAVVLVSASGHTPYVLGAARAAAGAGALTVALVCAEGSELGRLVEHELAVVVGPEVIAGSTRMKAGTAQKLVLNTISTVAMVRLGRTFGNLMVDVVPANAKLRARARRAVALATGAAEDEAAEALDAARGEAKVAILSLLAGVDADSARARLERAGGSVRKALAG